MGRNVGKVIILIIPCLTTLCLLSYCLYSQSWIQLDSTRLNSLTASNEHDFHLYANKNNNNQTTPQLIEVGSLVGKTLISPPSDTTSITAAQKTTPTPTTTLPTTTSTTTSSTNSLDVDYTDEDYQDVSGDDVAEGGGHAKRRRDTITDNLFNNGGVKVKKVKNSHEKEMMGGGGKKYGEFVFVTKLWPLIKMKSLYSECVEYRVMRLKMSVGYLVAEKKEPIVGELHYFDDGLFDNWAVDADECAQKPGNVFCRFTKSCKKGKSCDGIVDCEDQSDEQSCDQSSRICSFANDIAGFRCDSKCYQYWHKCDGIPHCFDLSDELGVDCQPVSILAANLTGTSYLQKTLASMLPQNLDPLQFKLGTDHYDASNQCFQQYFNFKSARLLQKDTLKYLSQSLADNVQETNNLNYHLQLIYTLAFTSALVFCLLALLSMLFLACFGKLCFQCPFWFFGFFQILAWLTSLCGLMTFLYAFWADKQRSLDPQMMLPIRSELIRLNDGLLQVERLGLSFWLAVGAVASAFLGSFLSCLVCCRLPSSRHEDKEYKIMQLPTYS